MPELGDVCSGKTEGLGGGRWMWCACIDCGKERWAQIIKGTVKAMRCRSCATHHFLAEHPEHGRGVNHSMWGKKHSVESIERMRVAHTGQLVGDKNPFYGKKHTAETLEKLRIASTGKKQSPESIAKRAASLQGYRHSPETIAKMRASQKNREPISEETRERLRVSHTGYKHTPEQTRKIAEGNTGKKVSAESVERIREAVRLTWATYSDKDKSERVRVLLSAAANRPNKVETTLLLLLWSISLDWTYTGDGSFLVGGKSPDYWNGDHRLIELFGDFWHKDDNPNDRIALFAEFGYQCIVIWEHEIYDDADAVKQRVIDFMGAMK